MGADTSSGWIPTKEEVDSYTQLARDMRTKCSTELEQLRSRLGSLQNFYMYWMPTQPLRLSKQQI